MRLNVSSAYVDPAPAATTVVAMFWAPSSSVTVSETVYEPALAYVCETVASPEVLPSPKFQRWAAIVPSASVDPVPSNVHASPAQPWAMRRGRRVGRRPQLLTRGARQRAGPRVRSSHSRGGASAGQWPPVPGARRWSRSQPNATWRAPPHPPPRLARGSWSGNRRPTPPVRGAGNRCASAPEPARRCRAASAHPPTTRIATDHRQLRSEAAAAGSDTHPAHWRCAGPRSTCTCRRPTPPCRSEA